MLGLIAVGSERPTLNQLISFLKFKSTEELNFVSSQLVTLVFTDRGSLGGPRLSFVNGIWVDRSLSLKPTFKKIVKSAYKAAASHVDFQTKVSSTILISNNLLFRNIGAVHFKQASKALTQQSRLGMLKCSNSNVFQTYILTSD